MLPSCRWGVAACGRSVGAGSDGGDWHRGRLCGRLLPGSPYPACLLPLPPTQTPPARERHRRHLPAEPAVSTSIGLDPLCFIFKSRPLQPLVPHVLHTNQQFYFCGIDLSHKDLLSLSPRKLVGHSSVQVSVVIGGQLFFI